MHSLLPLPQFKFLYYLLLFSPYQYPNCRLKLLFYNYIRIEEIRQELRSLYD